MWEPFRKKVPKLVMMPIFTKEISASCPRLFALSRDSSFRVDATSLVLQPLRDRRLIFDVKHIRLMGQSDNFLIIGIISESPLTDWTRCIRPDHCWQHGTSFLSMQQYVLGGYMTVSIYTTLLLPWLRQLSHHLSFRYH